MVSPDAIAVLGAGSWGTALAILLARNGFVTRLWGHLPEAVAALVNERENRVFLPGVFFPTTLQPTARLAEALEGVREILVAVPSHAFRATLAACAPHLDDSMDISWATKGFEPDTGKLLHEVASEVLGPRDWSVLSGPTFAREVALGLPTAITVAASTPQHAQRVAGYLHSNRFRAYLSDDLIGVEVGGATKNVLAIAAGIADGLMLGANTRAALITRGLAEIMRLGAALGGKRETFMGLAGLGDLALTCTDNQSRNRRFGLALASGQSAQEAQAMIGQEVEGIQTTQEVFRKAQRLGIEMPLCEQVYRVIVEGLSPQQSLQVLLERELRAEDQ
ncbi:MAG: NAD(P)H-dependent glycerol-3-phosphate dehydrogenase [Pseudomonadota bacterium]